MVSRKVKKETTNSKFMIFESERIKTFTNWPNDTDCNCTPEKLAQAGFFFKPSYDAPDNVCCAFCGKELDGWEPDDEPMQEHKKHSGRCPLLGMPQPLKVEKLTLVEFSGLIQNINLAHLETVRKKTIRDYEENARTVREGLVNHVNKRLKNLS